MSEKAIIILSVIGTIIAAILIYNCFLAVSGIKKRNKALDGRASELYYREKTLEDALSTAEKFYEKKRSSFLVKLNTKTLESRIDVFAEWVQKNLRFKSELIDKECKLEELSEAIHREADQYAEQVKTEADQYAKQVKIEADQYARQIKLEADKYTALIKHNAVKIADQVWFEADRYAEQVKIEVDQHAKEYIDANLKIQKEKEKCENYIRRKTAELVKLQSNLTALPYCAGIRADFETHGIELLAESLDWGQSQERAKKVASIRQIRAEAKEIAQRHIQAKYQLEYLLTMFPALEEVLDTEYGELPSLDISNISDYDKTRDWLSKEEYNQLNTTERNQLALDRYRESSRKSKWQIGRDYELFIGYELTRSGYIVDYFGSYMGLEDLGRDLIAKRSDKTLIVQCKYWSAQKQIHEKHVLQLYGTLVCYCMEHYIDINKAEGMLVTNITLSETAKRMAKYLKIKYKENYALGNYPCIKCNIRKNENGEKAFIYHLPFDQQYDHTKIDSPGEFFAMTVAEAENAGFRRALKWFGTGS